MFDSATPCFSEGEAREASLEMKRTVDAGAIVLACLVKAGEEGPWGAKGTFCVVEVRWCVFRLFVLFV